MVITDPDANVVAEFLAGDMGSRGRRTRTRVGVWATLRETIDVYGVDGEQRASLALPDALGGGDSGGCVGDLTV